VTCVVDRDDTVATEDHDHDVDLVVAVLADHACAAEPHEVCVEVVGLA
jgi:hypothetical protein